MFSLPSNVAKSSISSVTSRQQWRRPAALPAITLEADVEVDGPDAEAEATSTTAIVPSRSVDQLSFFRIVEANPGRKKVVKLAPCAGAHLSRLDMLVTLHGVVDEQAGESVHIYTDPSAARTSIQEPVQVLHSLGCDPAYMLDNLMVWSPTSSGLQYTVGGDPATRELITHMVIVGAFESNAGETPLLCADTDRPGGGHVATSGLTYYQ